MLFVLFPLDGIQYLTFISRHVPKIYDSQRESEFCSFHWMGFMGQKNKQTKSDTFKCVLKNIHEMLVLG